MFPSKNFSKKPKSWSVTEIDIKTLFIKLSPSSHISHFVPAIVVATKA
jgi:hypothetical protein